ncbi:MULTISPECIES: hypothetical protein [Chryseobacterium]|uniref:Acetyltransferase (GNAT) family protein n=1 Tax=Chryseobacterium geocarposphaerae TaxID=1416776 RepID=A0ABU1LFX3_9FLAO|nr:MULTISPECIES: hypothetical protein [Chryseobacterium]MDR6405616.1 hypothetical protein [Chryseobacterium geocarposphaerae]MDR6698847.1 hypothetical protein [Chryseobacterium ginsenosidimutans]
MIKKLKYNEIDFKKYTQCLENSEQRNWYAKKEVLDELSGHWEVVVYGDYEAVLPVPMRKKLGINFVIMPLFCQQLGVFSGKDNFEINNLLLQYLKKKYQVLFYSFNQNNLFTENLEKKKNYIIPISNYEILRRKKYFKGRKSTAKCAQHLIYKEIELNADSLKFIEDNNKGIPKKSDFEKFIKYLSFLDQNKTLQLCGAYLGEKLINLAVLISEKEQLSLLALINDETCKNENGPSFLIDKILQLYIHEKSFNFMGSNIRGIEVFFKSFGAELQEYCHLENKILKKIS